MWIPPWNGNMNWFMCVSPAKIHLQETLLNFFESCFFLANCKCCIMKSFLRTICKHQTCSQTLNYLDGVTILISFALHFGFIFYFLFSIPILFLIFKFIIIHWVGFLFWILPPPMTFIWYLAYNLKWKEPTWVLEHLEMFMLLREFAATRYHLNLWFTIFVLEGQRVGCKWQ